VDVILAKDPSFIRTEEARANYELLAYCRCTTRVAGTDADLVGYDLVIDALLGTGGRGTVREPYRSLISAANAAKCPVLSVDVPSGAGTDLQISAGEVVSLHERKHRDATVFSIGIPSGMRRLCGPGNVRSLARRSKDAHKRDGGTLRIIGGSAAYHGAPAFAGLAAAKVVDLVHMACPASAAAALRTISPDLIIEQCGATHLGTEVLALNRPVADCTLCGVGAGRDPETVAALLALYERNSGKLVIDADGLYALAGSIDSLHGDVCLTPHRGEYERLFGPLPENTAKAMETVEQAALEHGCTILLKGRVDIISNGGETWRNTTGNEGMATGGTGDVLAGTVAAFGCTNDLFDSALAGAFAVGRAGDVAYARDMTFFTAGDVVKELPGVLAFCLRW
jgi:NAD(P)H-hydrate epimerase